MHPLAPPASARRLEEEAWNPAAIESRAAELFEVVAVVGMRQIIHTHHGRRIRESIREKFGVGACRCADAGYVIDGATIEHAFRDLADDEIALARYCSVDERKLAHDFRAHRTFAIRAADED